MQRQCLDLLHSDAIRSESQGVRQVERGAELETGVPCVGRGDGGRRVLATHWWVCSSQRGRQRAMRCRLVSRMTGRIAGLERWMREEVGKAY